MKVSLTYLESSNSALLDGQWGQTSSDCPHYLQCFAYRHAPLHLIFFFAWMLGIWPQILFLVWQEPSLTIGLCWLLSFLGPELNWSVICIHFAVVSLFLREFWRFTSHNEAWSRAPLPPQLLTGPEIWSRILAGLMYLKWIPEWWCLGFEVSFCK